MDLSRSGDSFESTTSTPLFSSAFHRMSHDLRTPLNYINGFAELLLMDEALSPTNADYVRAILVGGEELKTTLIEYLDRIQAAPDEITNESDGDDLAESHRQTGSMDQRGLCTPANFRNFLRSNRT